MGFLPRLFKSCLSKGFLSKKMTEVWSIRKSDTCHRSLVELVEHYKNCDRGISCPLVESNFEQLPVFKKCGKLLEKDFLSISATEIELAENNILGKGGFGSVKSACFKNAKEIQIAIKFLKPDSKERKRDLLIREVELMQNLNHENVVRFIGLVMWVNKLFLIGWCYQSILASVESIRLLAISTNLG